MHKHAIRSHKYWRRKRPLKDQITCAVVGARGYAGLETSRLLLQHSGAELVECFATTAFSLEQLLSHPQAAVLKCLPMTDISRTRAEVVFLATPAEVSMELAPKLLAGGRKVIDLSGAFRLRAGDYPRWYGFEHKAAGLLPRAQYGLVPFVRPEAAELVANPGCYATAAALGLVPLLRAGLIDEKSIVIDAKSGTTGAGKTAQEGLLFSEVDGECLPYKVGRHQHYPEILATVQAFTGRSIEPHFTTSLLPVRRGIIAGIYARLLDGRGAQDVRQALHDAYAGYPLVSFGAIEERPNLLHLKRVVGTGRAHLSYAVDERRLYLFSCIDNLMKGAASQAIENFNRMYDLPIATGIEQLEGVI
jgi:N-acetyl-gamma-glutamyl-phosphate reductase